MLIRIPAVPRPPAGSGAENRRPPVPCYTCGRHVPAAEARVSIRALGTVRCFRCRRHQQEAEEKAELLTVRPVGAYGLFEALDQDGAFLAGGLSAAAARSNAALVLARRALHSG